VIGGHYANDSNVTSDTLTPRRVLAAVTAATSWCETTLQG
jgi:hypothetical protein